MREIHPSRAQVAIIAIITKIAMASPSPTPNFSLAATGDANSESNASTRTCILVFFIMVYFNPLNEYITMVHYIANSLIHVIISMDAII